VPGNGATSFLFLLSLSGVVPLKDGSIRAIWMTVAIITGSIILAEAMLEIHMDRKPVIVIMPRRSQAGLDPKRRIALKAIFL